MTELKPIPNFSRYLLASNGEIFARFTGRLLRQTPDKYGYRRQPLVADNGKTKCCYVHILVAEVYLDKPDTTLEEWEVDHLDGNAKNCSVQNLEWVTRQENMRRAFLRNGNWLRGNSKVSPIVRIGLDGSRERFTSVKLAAESINALSLKNGEALRSQTTISSNISAARKTKRKAYGFYWE